MNKVFLTGVFKKVAYKEGSSFMFKVGIRRDYKNKTTGKHDYDNVTVYAPAFNKTTIEFINRYVKDGDTVEVEGHVNTYSTEKDGNKAYHEDITCDSIRLIGGKGQQASGEKEGGAAESGSGVPEGFEIVDEDCPW